MRSIGRFIQSLPFLFLFAGCTPTPVSLPGYNGEIGGEKSELNTVVNKESNLVTIGAGRVRVGKYNSWHAWYLIDTETQTCWFLVGSNTQPLDCCNLVFVDAASPFLEFVSEADCSSD